MRQPGEWIHGKYQVEGILGAGGMGTVYATRRRNESPAAVKVLHPRFARDKTVRARFVEEGYLANRVGHPAVVTIIEDDIDENGNFYLVMEQLDGVDLAKFVGPPRTPVTISQALNIADQLLDALIRAHQKGIVHRDIKPANVMILRDGRVKLLDFGIAQALGADATVSALDDDDEEGAIGTDRYMSPEQGKGFLDETDARTDIWAVGALLLALLTEDEPSAVPLWDQSYEDRAWSFSRLGENVPPNVVQIISLALQPQKARRWASAATMKGAVEAAHLGLYGPLSREALADLAQLSLGPSAETKGCEEEYPLVLPSPVDPTVHSRRVGTEQPATTPRGNEQVRDASGSSASHQIPTAPESGEASESGVESHSGAALESILPPKIGREKLLGFVGLGLLCLGFGLWFHSREPVVEPAPVIPVPGEEGNPLHPKGKETSTRDAIPVGPESRRGGDGILPTEPLELGEPSGVAPAPPPTQVRPQSPDTKRMVKTPPQVPVAAPSPAPAPVKPSQKPENEGDTPAPASSKAQAYDILDGTFDVENLE